jgi:hypothetical protein
MNKTLALTLATATLAGAAALAAPSAQADPGAHDQASTTGLVAQIRKTVDPYRSVEAALEAGYAPVSGCESSPAGGMGVHYMNPAYAGGPVDPAKPTILLYGPDGNGGLRLLGAEWWRAYTGPDQDRPMLGGEPFNGPMPGHDEHMPTHYDLHVWTHVANPAGVFAPWNPNVSC